MDLATAYQDYIGCLNRRDWKILRRFVQDDVHHNGQHLGVAGYRAMLEYDYAQIPDLFFIVELLVAGEHHIASRLLFEVTPRGEFLGLPVMGRKIIFREHAFYTYRDNRIANVWSIIDKAAIEAQLG